ncbi:hypothetical protein CFP65_0677 [Kitasatospora sp. MMS16-BH015]|uniref:RICIN domain-containing protein n=1 Tax=Kitasatospora sp. MMS16-BH015 TaxID=2018025 RepID=UPI000CA1EE6D|nr:RICIN domain-containing protein [Kitasatospora sp. MMS16-BH015]AUG75631.1 hypothetical protein CFP65_0677 [Kitasatospora sp. MMS16-BH015]
MKSNALSTGRRVRAAVAVATALICGFGAAGTAAAQAPVAAGPTAVVHGAVAHGALRGSVSLSPDQLRQYFAAKGAGTAGSGTAGSGAAEAGAVRANVGLNGIYNHLTNDNSLQCLTLPGASSTLGAQLVQSPCGTGNEQYWTANYQFSDLGYYWYHLQNYTSGQCLALPGASTAAGAQVIQWPCGGWADHYWAFVVNPAGRMQIVNYDSRECLALPGASTAPGAPVVQWPCGTYPDHYWH